jgi:hypothetical protein
MPQTRNYWYIDVKEEYVAPIASTATSIAIAGALPKEFTVGPIGPGGGFALGYKTIPEGFTTEYTSNGDKTGPEITPVEIVDAIQAAFDEALEDGRTDHQYLVGVKAVSIPAGTQYPNLRNQMAVVLQYSIRKTSVSQPDFTFLFTSGPNGANPYANGQFAADIAVPESDGTANKHWPVASFSVINEPAPAVFSTPYCTQTVMIADKPPVPPDVVFVPYVGVNNKVLVLFSSNVGEILARPVILKNSDASFIADEYYAQKGITITEEQVLTPDVGELTRPKLEYRNDDPIRKYELFRVDQKPTSYDDFRGKNLTDEPIQAELGPDKFSTAPAFVDNIQPNRKYWYCARSIDIHENISNPTYIFEIEMVDNKGQMYMRHKVVNFEPQVLNYKKTGRKILAIEPRNMQRYYNAANPPSPVALNEVPTSNILGTSEVNSVSSIWNKKFKVRITSKKTGRKIDLNLTFKNTGVVIP